MDGGSELFEFAKIRLWFGGFRIPGVGVCFEAPLVETRSTAVVLDAVHVARVEGECGGEFVAGWVGRGGVVIVVDGWVVGWVSFDGDEGPADGDIVGRDGGFDGSFGAIRDAGGIVVAAGGVKDRGRDGELHRCCSDNESG